MTDIVERCTAYLSDGGLFNPELAIHDEVRNLVIDCRDEIERLKDELDTWKSVFPDIAPESVLPDRSGLEKEIERLREDKKRLHIQFESLRQSFDWCKLQLVEIGFHLTKDDNKC